MKNLFFISVFAVLSTAFFTSCEKITSESEEENSPPQILSVTADETTVHEGERIHLFCNAVDPDNNQITYEWNDGGAGIFYSNGSSSTTWESPETDNDFIVVIYVYVRDEEEMVIGHVSINVLADEQTPEEPEEPSEGELTIYASKDVYVSEADPDVNFDYTNNEHYGGVLKLAPEGSYDGEYRIYIYFDLDEIPQDVTIEEAEITMYNAGEPNNSGTNTVCGINMLNRVSISSGETYWSETSLTWNSVLNQHVNNLGDGILFEINSQLENLNVSIKTFVQGYVNGSSNVVSDYSGFVIKSFGSGENVYDEYKTFLSSEFNDQMMPKLYVKYSY